MLITNNLLFFENMDCLTIVWFLDIIILNIGMIGVIGILKFYLMKFPTFLGITSDTDNKDWIKKYFPILSPIITFLICVKILFAAGNFIKYTELDNMYEYLFGMIMGPIFVLSLDKGVKKLINHKLSENVLLKLIQIQIVTAIYYFVIIFVCSMLNISSYVTLQIPFLILFELDMIISILNKLHDGDIKIEFFISLVSVFIINKLVSFL